MRHEDRDAAVNTVTMGSGGVALEQCVFGLGVERGRGLVEDEQQRPIAHEARASASFCHWPNDTSTPPGHVGPSCVSSPDVRRDTTSLGAGPLDRRHHRALVVHASDVAQADRLARAELEAEKVLEGACEARTPFRGGHTRERRVVDENGSGCRLVHFREQLDERRLPRAVLADDGDDRAGGQQQRDVVEDQPRRTRVCERDMVEANASTEAFRNGQVRGRGQRRGVVLEPREAPRAVHPEAAQESNLADGRANVRGKARSRREHQQDIGRGRAEA